MEQRLYVELDKKLDQRFEAFTESIDDRLNELPTRADFNTLKADVADIKDTVHELKRDSDAYAKDIVRLDKAVNRIQNHLQLEPAS